MKRMLFAFGLTAMLLTLGAATGDEKPKDKEEKKPAPALALPPHPLDSAFEKGNAELALTNDLINHEQYKRAIKAALKAKQDVEAVMKQKKNYAGPSPAAAARVAFLKVINETGLEKDDKK